jgi:hypothetical protein
LAESLDILLANYRRCALRTASASTSAGHIREGAKLAVRLAEMIQATDRAGG